MITNKVLKYIEENKLCSDYLFDDWSEFLKLLYEQGGCVESILWFEHVLIAEHEKSLGGGGYIDKNNVEYMYAETYICNNDLKNKTLDEVNEYIKSVVYAYPNHKLIPSFDIL